MSLAQYVRDKWLFLLAQAGLAAFLAVFLSAFALPFYAVVFVVVVAVAANAVVFFHEYTKKREYYTALLQTLENLDQKHLISELAEPANFQEGGILYEILKASCKSMNDKIAEYKALSADYREYIESWVHEIKTPIASAALTAENNQSEVSQSMGDDLSRIETLVSQVLFFARSDSVEKDYLIRECRLQDIVNASIRNNARQLIKNNIKVQTEKLDSLVYTDEKWLVFILGQVIQNAIKYKREQDSLLRFSARESAQYVELFIQDNGIGIPPQDLPRVFDKGFTGQNGRLYTRATGIGLYLCKKLCDRLGLTILAGSREGASITIRFPKSDFNMK